MARTIDLPGNGERVAWKWMRLSGLLLIPLAWGHVLIQDVLIGVDRINLNYVSLRWAYIGWRVYDLFLLVFALAHGINGLRQIILDFVSKKKNIRWVNRGLFLFWFILVLLGIAALVGGVRKT
jgi:succinate dehydrogenase / fumarate reductase membrane anchor subunit